MNIPGVFLFLIFLLGVVPNDVTCKNRPRRQLPLNTQPSPVTNFKTLPAEMLPFTLQQCNEEPDILHAKVTCGYSGCYVECADEYRMASGLEGINLHCDHSSGKLTFNGKPWLPEDVACLPYCGILGCLHGGTCIEPQKCQCQTNYRGDHCELPPDNAPLPPAAPVVYPETCKDPEFPVINAEVTRNGEQLLVRCAPEHEFSIGGTVAFIQCRAGRWDYPRGIFLSGGALMCQEMKCQPPCQNGGTCLPGGVCDCPYKYWGATCGSLRCTLPKTSQLAHASIGGTSSRMKIQCHPGHIMLSNKRTETILCRNGLWVVPRRGYLVDIDVKCYANDLLESVKSTK